MIFKPPSLFSSTRFSTCIVSKSVKITPNLQMNQGKNIYLLEQLLLFAADSISVVHKLSVLYTKCRLITFLHLEKKRIS